MNYLRRFLVVALLSGGLALVANTSGCSSDNNHTTGAGGAGGGAASSSGGGNAEGTAGAAGGAPIGAACVPSPSITGSFDPQWSYVLGQADVDGVQANASGNLIVLGSFFDTLDVGAQQFSGPADSTNHPYALELASDGHVVWERTFPDNWSPTSFALDGSGNIYLVATQGAFVPTPANLGDGPISGPVIIAELDPQGNTIWSDGLEAFLDPSETQVSTPTLALSPTGRVAVAGATFGGKSPGGFLAEYDASGTFLWSMSPGANALPVGLGFDSNDDVVVAGKFQGALAWGGSSTNGSGFATKIDPAQNVVWNVPFGEYTSAGVVAVDTNHAYVAGSFSGSLTLGGRAIAAQGLDDVFLVTIDDGSPPVASLVARFAASGPDQIVSLLPDGQSGLFALALTGDYVDFGTGPTPGGATVLHLEGGGHTIGRASFSASDWLSGGSIATDAAGDVYLAVRNSDAAIDLGHGIVSVPPTQYQSLLGKYTPAATQIAVRSCPPPAGALLGNSVVYPSNIALAGDVLAFTTGTETMTIPLAGGTPTVQATAQKQTIALATDARSIYWANAGTRLGPGNDGSIVSMPIAGGTPTVLADAQPEPTAIAVDDQNVYWTTLGGLPATEGYTPTNGGVWAIPIGGGMPVPLATGLTFPGPLAAGNGSVVFAVSVPGNGSALMSVSRSGGPATMIATTDRAVDSIVLDAAKVYWIDGNSLTVDVSSNNGRIRSAPLTGGAGATLVDQQPGPFSLFLIGDQLYWAVSGGFNNAASENTGGVWQIPAVGGTPTAVVTGLSSVAPFAVDTADLVWGQTASGSSTWELIARAR
jgi:hypothetical protein